MAFQLNIATGSQAGKVIEVPPDAPISIGRTRAMMLFPDDPTMSGLHFEVLCNGETVALQNFSQTNGTYVNGARVEKVLLHTGDVILAGGTQFTLAAGGQDTPAGATRIKDWIFPTPAPEWETATGQGFRYVKDGSQHATLIVTEDKLPAGHNFDQYLDIQLTLLGRQLSSARAEKVPVKLPGVESSAGLAIRTEFPDRGNVIQKQIYACIGEAVGILTATALESEPAEIHEAVDRMLATAAFNPQTHKPEPPDSTTTQAER